MSICGACLSNIMKFSTINFVIHRSVLNINDLYSTWPAFFINYITLNMTISYLTELFICMISSMHRLSSACGCRQRAWETLRINAILVVAYLTLNWEVSAPFGNLISHQFTIDDKTLDQKKLRSEIFVLKIETSVANV